jgi:hypothetical protein
LLNYLFVGGSVPFCIACRETRNVRPSQANETGTFYLLPKSANMKLNRIELISESLKKSAGGSKMMSKMDTHPTDLQRS